MTTLPLQQALPAALFPAFIVFARMGTAISLLPGFGETYVPVRIRLVVAGAISMLVAPLLGPSVPVEPKSLLAVFTLMAAEIVIGLFLGLASRILLAALETGGAIIAMQTSLSSALVYNPGAPQPQTLPAGLFSTLAVILIFVTGSYRLLLHSAVDSYGVFPIGGALPLDDMSNAIVHLVSRSFTISVELAAPYLIIGTLFYILLGLGGRIMPQLQVFYIAMPLQLVGGLAMLALTLSGTMLWFLGAYGEALSALTRAR